MISDWRASIGGADLADWITVSGYLCAAFLSTRAAIAAAERDERPTSAFWWIVGVSLVALGINKVLDLQTLLTALGRALAKANGWYHQRREVQFAFVVSLALAMISAIAATLWFTRHAGAAVRLAQVGLASIITFILLRAASIHHVDALLGYGRSAFPLGPFQEIAGIVVVAWGAALDARRN